MTAPIRVVIADDQPLVRESLAVLLDTHDDITVVGQAAYGREAIDLTTYLCPDVVLMDIRMPELDGLAATAHICADPALAQVRVCVLTMFEADDYVFGALEAGASGFLLKDATPADLAAAVRRIHSGEQALAPAALRRVIERALTSTNARITLPASITPRETEVLTLVGRGLSNPEIEATLHISRGTLKTHISHLLTKLDARDRPQLIITAHRAGLVSTRHSPAPPDDRHRSECGKDLQGAGCDERRGTPPPLR